MRPLFFAILIFFTAERLGAGETETLQLAEIYLAKGYYHSAIAESIRFQSYYPESKRYPESKLIYSKAKFLSGDVKTGLNSAYTVYNENISNNYTPLALRQIVYMNLLTNRYANAAETIDAFMIDHRKNALHENIALESISLKAIEINPMIFEAYNDFKNRYPDSKYRHDADNIINMYEIESKRKHKSAIIAFAGSIVLPGFGHFYAGNWRIGVLSFATNAVLASMIYYSYKKKDNVKLIIFSLAEMTFYQYQLTAALRNVQDYNSHEHYKKEIIAGIESRF